MVTCCADTPTPEIVIIPVRSVVDVFSWQVTVSVPSLLPLVGLTLIQLNDSETVQLVVAEMETVAVPPGLLKSREAGETINVGAEASCVIVTTWFDTPDPDIVTKAVRAPPGFGVQKTVTAPELLPEEVLSVTQGADEDAIQFILDAIEILLLPPSS